MPKALLTCLITLLTVLLINACSDDDPDPVSSTQPNPARILVLEDGGTEDSLYVVLDAAGFDVTHGGPYYDHTNTDFSAYDLVILLNGVDYGETIEDSIQQAMKDYVTAGGVLLTLEWMLEEGYYDILESFIPVEYNDDYSYASETYIKMAAHEITAAVPDSFATNDDWSLVYMAELPDASTESTNRTVLFRGLEGGPALTIGDLGSGHTIHWAMAGEYNGSDIWSDEVKQIFVNIAEFSK
ncbi:MAG: hypothetical protein GY867_01990 [bacterium]|nr:hypothetical protein [bacterium]